MGGSHCLNGPAAASPLQFAFAAWLAQVAEVDVAKDGAVRVRRVACAVAHGFMKERQHLSPV
jgi:isoquinoline 1-oxidoreductase beta subunit